MIRSFYMRAMLVLALATAFGCSKEDLTGALDKAKNAVVENAEKAKDVVQEKMETTTEQVQEQLNLAGSFELTAGEPLKTDACYVRLVQQSNGRPTVLQLASYRDVEREAFPSVFLQAQVEAASLSDLVGKTISGRLFIQREANGPVLFSEDGSPVELSITSVDEQLMSAELTNAKLRETTSAIEIPVTGTLQGVVE